MPLEKLTKAELAKQSSVGANAEYVHFLQSLKPGEGGRTTVEAEGVSRQTIKSRLKKAADYLGVKIRFVRSDPDQVVFQLLSK